MKAIAKETKDVSIIFDLKEKGEKASPGYIKSMHIIRFILTFLD